MGIKKYLKRIAKTTGTKWSVKEFFDWIQQVNQNQQTEIEGLQAYVLGLINRPGADLNAIANLDKRISALEHFNRQIEGRYEAHLERLDRIDASLKKLNRKDQPVHGNNLK